MKTKKENNIPENEGIERRKVVIGYSNRGGGKKVKYSKTTFALVYQGYDMLENLIVVRNTYKEGMILIYRFRNTTSLVPNNNTLPKEILLKWQRDLTMAE
jgi:hypothetical protein